jgi:Holliday junction resolvase-like predicted endonuclease
MISNYHFESKGRRIVHIGSGKSVRGAANWFRICFCPQGNGRPPPSFSSSSSSSLRPSRKTGSDDGTRKLPPWMAKQLGTRVDRQLTEVANLISNARDAAMERSNHRHTRSVLLHLHQRGYSLVAAQFGVGCEKSRLGTLIDLLVRDHQGRLVAVEVKHSHPDDFGGPGQLRKDRNTNRGLTSLREPFDMYDDTPYSRAQMQLAVGVALLIENENVTKTADFGTHVVYRVHFDGVQTYALEPLMLELVKLVLCRERESKLKKKRKSSLGSSGEQKKRKV